MVVLMASAALADESAEDRGKQAPSNADVGITQKLDVSVPLNLTFRDETGRRVALEDLFVGRPVILNLVYYECPMLCNLALSELVTSLRALSLQAGDDFTVITVSFDPHEGPDLAAAAKRTALSRYRREGAERHWHFLTGERRSIDELANAVGFRYRYDEKTGQYVHAAGVLVLTPDGRTSRYLLGVEYPARDLRLSLVEASNHKIGTLADQALLLCYQYDPSSGKYGLLIQNVLRLAGAATVIVLGAGVAGMLIHERRKSKRIPPRETWLDGTS